MLTSNILPMADVAGKGALKVDPFDVSGIRSGIMRLLEDASLRDDLIQKGFQNVERYSAIGVAEQYAAVYREVLE